MPDDDGDGDDDDDDGEDGDDDDNDDDDVDDDDGNGDDNNDDGDDDDCGGDDDDGDGDDDGDDGGEDGDDADDDVDDDDCGGDDDDGDGPPGHKIPFEHVSTIAGVSPRMSARHPPNPYQCFGPSPCPQTLRRAPGPRTQIGDSRRSLVGWEVLFIIAGPWFESGRARFWF